MSRTTAGKLASKTAAAAKRVTATGAKKAVPAAEPTPPAKPAAAKKASATKKAAPTAKRATPATKKAAPTVKKTASAAQKAAPATKKAPPAKKTATKSPVKAAATKKGATSTPSTRPPATGRAKGPGGLAVKADESPWTAKELDAVKAELGDDVRRLQDELDLAGRELDGLMRDAGDGAGHDQADVGSTTFERDHEMSLANNARDMLVQTRHALERIEDGSYGVCESCGQPIGKNRLMAFPRATLCLPCKQREERR